MTSGLFVLAGPTAVGKGTVVDYIRQHHPDIYVSISATTRAPRPGEIDGVSYFFLSEIEFNRLIESGDMLEYAIVHGRHRYGTPRGPVDEQLALGRSVLLEIDLQGARQVRQSFPSSRSIFLLPPSWEELVRRLRERGTESEEEGQRRLATAQVELAAAAEFDYQIVNADVAECASQVVTLLKS